MTMDSTDTSQPKNPKFSNTAAYVAIGVVACAAAAALGFLARSFVGTSDTVGRILPSVNTVFFIHSTDLADLQRWTDGPLVRSASTGSGSTASGSSLSGKLNAFHATMVREIQALTTDASTPPTALTIAFLQTGTAGVSPVAITEYADEATTVRALEGMTTRAGNSTETEIGSGTVTEVRPAHVGKDSLSGFATRIGNRIVFSHEQSATRSVLNTSKDKDLSLSASRVYSSGRLSEIPGLRIYADYPKAVAVLKSILQSDRAWRDTFTLLAPLEQNLSGIHATIGRASGEYHLRIRVMATSKVADALMGTEEDRRAPALSQDGEVLAISGYDLLHGYRRFAEYLGVADPDSRTVLEALSRYFLSTYVTPRLSPATLSDASRGGYSFSMVETGSGSLASYGWIGIDGDKVTPTHVTGWFSDFATDSRLMFTERSRPLRIGSGESVPERYLAPLSSEKEQAALGDGTVLHSVRTGTAFSPSAFLRDGRLFFATERALAERMATGDTGGQDRESPVGAWLLRMRFASLLGITLGPVDGMEIALSRGNGGLRIDGSLSIADKK